MKCGECGKEFEKEQLQKCIRGYFCLSCIDEMMDRYYDSEAEYENDTDIVHIAKLGEKK